MRHISLVLGVFKAMGEEGGPLGAAYGRLHQLRPWGGRYETD
jgi:hypothetical protein